MANSRDFTGKNRKFTGTKGIVISKGTTGERVGAEAGEFRFNTTTELMEYYDGNQWKPIDAPPSIVSILTSDAQGTNNILNADGSTLHTITINGSSFGFGVTVKFIGSTGTEYVAGNITRVSGSSITCKTTASMGTTDDPYDIQVTNPSGLSALLEDAFSFNAAPVFTNASGQLGTVYNTQVISGTTFNAGATDAEGNTITFSIISGSLPGSGLTLSSSTGAITGTLSGTPSLGNYPFVVRASTTEGVVERQFSIQVVAQPFAATGGTTSTVGLYTAHTFLSSSNFVVSGGVSKDVEYLIVAGGGGGGGRHGGGGGAGGMRTGTVSSVTAGTYVVSVGGGGSGNTGDNTRGTSGVDSSVLSITSIGGGGGGGHPTLAALSGGSGGGGGWGNSGAAGTSGQGNAGGNSGGQGGAGGGGKGAGGGGATDPGGAGAQSNIDGNNYYYAGGGGGGSWSDPGGAGNGGIGGGGGGNSTPGGGGGSAGTGGGSARNPGGNGQQVPNNGVSTVAGSGGANTGGGGGSGEQSGYESYVGVGGNGGTGIVIVRYLT
jgi:hypothetical protein